MAITRHVTLAPSAAQDVVLHEELGSVGVLNITGTAPVYFRADGVTATVEGDDTLAVPVGARRSLSVETPSHDDGTVHVSLISAAAAKVEIEFA